MYYLGKVDPEVFMGVGWAPAEFFVGLRGLGLAVVIEFYFWGAGGGGMLGVRKKCLPSSPSD